jgi:organic radical activating enzyme
MKIPIKEVINKYSDVLQITWVINNICSNKCNYCVPALHSGNNHGYEWEAVKAFFEEIFKRYPKIHVSIAGGEPTMSPFLLDLCKMIHERGSTVGITSNGTRNVEYYSELSKYLQYIVYSYHPQYGDRNSVMDKISTSIKNCYCTLRIMMSPTHWDTALEMYNTIKEHPLIPYFNMEAVKILDWAQADRTTLIYTPEQLEWFGGETRCGGYKTSELNIKSWANIGSDFVLEDGSIDESADAVDYINQGLTDFYGWECEMGLESLFIFADGEIKRGNCTSFYIGNINKLDEIKWPTNTVICPWHICHCATDVLISKRSPELMKYTDHDRKIF